MVTEFITDREVETILNDVIRLFLIPRFDELGMNATGEWRDNVESRGSSIYGRDYTVQLVHGRRPNEDQNPNAIRKWAYGMAKFNPEFMAWLSARGLEQYGIQIAYKIGEQGTQYYRDGGTKLLEVLNEPETINYIAEQAGSIISDNMVKDINKQLLKFTTI